MKIYAELAATDAGGQQFVYIQYIYVMDSLNALTRMMSWRVILRSSLIQKWVMIIELVMKAFVVSYPNVCMWLK